MKKEIRNILRKNVVKEREEKEPPLGISPKKAVELMIGKRKVTGIPPEEAIGSEGEDENRRTDPNPKAL